MRHGALVFLEGMCGGSGLQPRSDVVIWCGLEDELTVFRRDPLPTSRGAESGEGREDPDGEGEREEEAGA